MPISIRCPSCQRNATLPDATAGKSVQCNCGKVFEVPARAQSSADELELQSHEPAVTPPSRDVPTSKSAPRRRSLALNSPDPASESRSSARAKSGTTYWGADLFDWSLKKMITPTLIRSQYFWGVIFWLLLCVGAAVGALFVPDIPGAMRLGAILGSLVLAYIGLVTWRMAAEGMILFFNIYEVLMQIRDSEPPE